MYNNNPLRVLTGECRLSYCNLITPKKPKGKENDPNAKAKYSVTLLIPKTDVATKADIDQSIEAAAQAAISSTWGGFRPPNTHSVIHDGDGVRQDGRPYGDECKGHWVITASTEIRPQVVGIDNINCELDPRDIYSGMYARVTLGFYAFNSNGNKGVGCGLGNVMKTRDGEALAGGASAASDFAGVGQSVVPQQASVPQAQMGYTTPAATGAPMINPVTGLPM